MQIQISTDANIEWTEELAARIGAVVEAALNRFTKEITRVEVHLSDPGGGHGETMFRCVLEARLARSDPTVVTDEAPGVEQAARGAAQKMKRVLGRESDRSHDHHPHQRG